MIGRAASGEGRLGDDAELSRRHARVARDADGRLTIEDLGSANGTFVNGVRGARAARAARRATRCGSAGRRWSWRSPGSRGGSRPPRPLHRRRPSAGGCPSAAGCAPARRCPSAAARFAARPAAGRRRPAAAGAAPPPAPRPSPAPAARPVPPPSRGAARRRAPRGTVFAGCRVEEVIGHGDMGVVYRAEELALQRPVALKLILPEHSEEERFRERFRRESKVAASIDHPNVIPILDAGDEDGRALHQHAPGRGHRPARADRRGGTRRPPAGRAHRPAGRRRARRRPRARAGAPRRQAGQRAARARRPRLPERLRAREARRARPAG